MKKIIPTLFTFFLFQIVAAQQSQPIFTNNPFPKTISVSGSAEMEVIPDEIYVNIELKEYQKKGENKKDIETIREQFLGFCKEAGIADSLISIESYSGNNNYYSSRKKRKNTDLFAGITYQVKFTNNKTMDKLVEKLDDDATQNFVISRVSHSSITEFRKQLKIRAVQTAKEKAIYLTESIGEKLGEAITIAEPAEWQGTSVRNYASQAISYQSNLSSSPKWEGGDVDFKKLKLRFEVNAVYALK